MPAITEAIMDEWLNVILRTLMCGLFIFWVVKPMLMG